MQGGIGKDKIQLLIQAIAAASSSLTLAKQLLSEIERQGGNFSQGTTDVPGLVGKYDGMFMITEAGKKYPVPDNYSAKTKLVYGDKLKMIEGPEGRRFKLLEESPRIEAEAQLALKDGRFEALGKEGSYKLIQGAVRWWSGAEGDKVKILLPQNEKHAPFAALVEIIGKKPGEVEEGVVDAPVKKLPSPAVERTTPSVAKPTAPKVEKPAEKKELEKPVEKEAPKEQKEEKLSVAKSTEAPREGGKEEKPAAKKEEKEPSKEIPRPKADQPPAEKKTTKPVDEEELR